MKNMPGEVGTDLQLQWDDPEFELDPYPYYEVLQREAPVSVDETGAYLITKFDDVVEFGGDPRMSVEPGWDRAGPWAIASHTVIGRDDPDHARLRRQTNRWFAPKLVKDWVATTRAVTIELLDGLVGDQIDGWHDLSVVPTHRTMCRVLQVPDRDSDQIKVAMERSMPMLSARPRPGTVEMAQESFDFLAKSADEFLAKARARPGDSLVHALIEAQSRGEMSEAELRATVLVLYGLGHMDVGYIIASGLVVFAERPEVFQLFRTDPEMRYAIINEIVRLDPPELSFYRTTLEPVQIRGVDIPAGATVRFMIGAANRDSDVFPNPHDFDPRRPGEQSRHLSFGTGPHSCVGQVISRAEAMTVFEVLAERYSRIELVEPVVMKNNDFSRHFQRLSLRLVA